MGCMWIIMNCLAYPGVRYLIGRSRLNVLKRTTLKTFFDLIKQYKLDNTITYNSMNNTIHFVNGSEVLLIDLFPFPADENYDRLGSLEITGAFIDELSEISYKGFEVLGTRIRYRLNEYNLIPKLFTATNPCQGWSKNYFYMPFIDGTLPDHIKFIPALPTDNPHLSIDYLESLDRTLDPVLKRRLLHGDWDFDNDEMSLFKYEHLQQLFYNNGFDNHDHLVYITADIADLGNDKTVIGIWKGWALIDLIKLQKKETTQVVDELRILISKYKVPINRVIVDAVGVGAGVASLLKGCVRYGAGERPLNGQNFTNIKAQLMYHFSQKIERAEASFNIAYNDEFIQEALLYKKVLKENKAGVIGKDDVKRQLGRSPDTMDSLYLRAYFDVAKKGINNFSIIS